MVTEEFVTTCPGNILLLCRLEAEIKDARLKAKEEMMQGIQIAKEMAQQELSSQKAAYEGKIRALEAELVTGRIGYPSSAGALCVTCWLRDGSGDGEGHGRAEAPARLGCLILPWKASCRRCVAAGRGTRRFCPPATRAGLSPGFPGHLASPDAPLRGDCTQSLAGDSHFQLDRQPE